MTATTKTKKASQPQRRGLRNREDACNEHS